MSRKTLISIVILAPPMFSMAGGVPPPRPVSTPLQCPSGFTMAPDSPSINEGTGRSKKEAIAEYDDVANAVEKFCENMKTEPDAYTKSAEPACRLDLTNLKEPWICEGEHICCYGDNGSGSDPH